MKRWPVIIFIGLLASVFVIYLNHRTEHFQECDSNGIYEQLKNFPASSISFSASLGQGSFISEIKAKEILSWSPSQKLIDFYKERYKVQNEEEFNRRVMRALTRLNPITAFRLAYIAVLSQIPLPYSIQSFFALPTASTYSPGAGLLFGLINSSETSYESFMSRGTFLTLFLFILSVLLVFLTSKKMGVSTLISALVATLMLFSISLYSYGYHLGSTTFNVVSVAIWLFFLVKYKDDDKLLKKMSWVTAILLFFNYLIGVFWLSLFATLNLQKFRGFKKNLLDIYPLILIIIFIFIFFYPPGQSYRGVFDISLIPSHIYNIILNFFGFYNHGQILNAIQFSLAAILIFIACLGQKSFLKKFAATILVIYLLFVAAYILAFYPSRHLLIFAPLVFVFVAVGLEDFISRFNLPRGAFLFLWFTIIIFGFTSLFVRINDTKDRITSLEQIDSDIEKVFIFDCSSSLRYKDWQSPVSIEIMKSVSFLPKVGKVYMYISQGQSLNHTLDSFKKEQTTASYQNLQIEVLSDLEERSDVCFIGYHRNKDCGFGASNSRYQTKFRIK